MNPSDDGLPTNDLLARAEAAMRDAPIPEGPSPESLARTLAAVCAATDVPGPRSLRSRSRIMFVVLKLAAASLAVAAGVFYALVPSPAPASALFEQAVQKLQDARTLGVVQTVRIDGVDAPMTSRVLYRAPSQVRTESEPVGGPISVLDLSLGKTMILDPAQRSALLVDSPPRDEPGSRTDAATMMIEDLRRLADQRGEAIGERVIDGVRARGYRVEPDASLGQEMTVWVDPDSVFPVLVEASGRLGDRAYHFTFTEIRLDPPVDDILFRLVPPEGYALREATANLAMTPEQAIVKLLRLYADANDRAFPPRLDDPRVFGEAIAARRPAGEGPLNAEVLEFATAAGHLAVFLQQHRDRSEYRPEGVAFGDVDRILFWYRPVAGDGPYRALFGDLRFEDASAEGLPERPDF